MSAGEQKQSVYGVGFDQHSAHARGRPIAWIVVAVIIAGTFVSGISLVMAAPWLFWTGVGVVVLGIILGRTTHAMRDELAPRLAIGTCERDVAGNADTVKAPVVDPMETTNS